MRFTKAYIEELKAKEAKGLIRGFSEKPVKKNSTIGNKIPKADRKIPKAGKNIPAKKRNKTKDWISKNLWYWSQANKLELKAEHLFHPDRKWRFDWAFPDLMIAIEYEGLMSEKSRHTTVTGFTGDSEKYNEAQRLGWRVFRYTAINHKDIISDLNKILEITCK